MWVYVTPTVLHLQISPWTVRMSSNDGSGQQQEVHRHHKAPSSEMEPAIKRYLISSRMKMGFLSGAVRVIICGASCAFPPCLNLLIHLSAAVMASRLKGPSGLVELLSLIAEITHHAERQGWLNPLRATLWLRKGPENQRTRLWKPQKKCSENHNQGSKNNGKPPGRLWKPPMRLWKSYFVYCTKTPKKLGGKAG